MKKKETVWSPHDWRQYRKDSNKNPKYAEFRLLERQMFDSDAFSKLNRSGILVVLSMLNKLRYHPRRKNSDRKYRGTGGELVNNGEFTLTGNELKSRGLTSEGAIRDGKEQAWELGFFDVIRSGTVNAAGLFKYSKRWKEYPHGDYKPIDQQRPGVRLYNAPPPPGPCKTRDNIIKLPAKNAGK